MLARIWSRLLPRDCWDLETRRVAGAVRAVGLCFVLGTLPALYLQWANNWFKGFVILLATEAASLAALALNQRGKTEEAAGTLSWAGLLCACSMVYFSREGYRDLALLLFPAMLAYWSSCPHEHWTTSVEKFAGVSGVIYRSLSLGNLRIRYLKVADRRS